MSENNNLNKKHKIKIIYRERVEISGVVNVLTYDDKEMVFKLSDNVLTVTGEGFNIEMLNLETGEICATGSVKALNYSKGREKVSLIKRLLK